MYSKDYQNEQKIWITNIYPKQKQPGCEANEEQDQLYGCKGQKSLVSGKAKKIL